MNTQTILVALLALLVGGVGGYAIGDNDTPYGMRGYEKSVGADDTMDAHRMHGGMMSDSDDTVRGMGQMDHMMAMMVSSEREFIEGMIPHHQEAIDTAREVLERGATTPDIRQLVEGIITAQEAEIADMKAWYEAWYGESYVDADSYMPMMRELTDLSGVALDRVFLEDMIMHHMGAIMMARSVQPYVEHEEMATLTQNIVSSQSAEIAEMRQLLRGF